MRSMTVLAVGLAALLLWIWLSLTVLCPTCAQASSDAPQPAAEPASLASAASDGPAQPFALKAIASGLRLEGEVSSETVRAQLLSRARALYAPSAVEDGLQVRTDVANVAWVGRALAAFPFPLPQVSNPDITISATQVRLRGGVPNAAVKARLGDDVAAAMVGFEVVNEFAVASPAPAPVISDGASVKVAARSTADVQQEISKRLTDQTIEFETGKAVLSRSGRTLLDSLLPLLQDSTATVQILGHTDDRGSAAKNLALSTERAEAVRDYLVEAGIAVARLKATGVGEAKPIASNRSSAGRAQNRRIEFQLSE